MTLKQGWPPIGCHRSPSSPWSARHQPGFSAWHSPDAWRASLPDPQLSHLSNRSDESTQQGKDKVPFPLTGKAPALWTSQRPWVLPREPGRCEVRKARRGFSSWTAPGKRFTGRESLAWLGCISPPRQIHMVNPKSGDAVSQGRRHPLLPRPRKTGHTYPGREAHLPQGQNTQKGQVPHPRIL